MTRRMNVEKELRWREIFKQQVDSGLSVRQFCATQSVSMPSFYAWRRRLQTPLDDGPTAAKTTVPSPDVQRHFVPLQVLDSAARLEIVHPSGCRIQVTGEVDVVTLRRVIETLDVTGFGEGAAR